MFVAGGLLLVVGLASFSDRAPSLVAAVERRLHLPRIGESALHLLGWMAVTLLVTVALKGVRARWSAAAGIVLLGIAIEVLQPALSSNRTFEPGDIVANVLGVAIGLAVGTRIANAAWVQPPTDDPDTGTALGFLEANGLPIFIGFIAVVAAVGAAYLIGLDAAIALALMLLVVAATVGVYRLRRGEPITWSERLDRRKLVTSAVLGMLLVGAIIQVVPYGRDHSNPPITAEPAWDSPETRALTVRACFDCHSNEVEYPWYANVAPFSWAIQTHIEEGRSDLNFSEWDRRQKNADESAETVRDGEMPPDYFTRFTHPEARFTDAEEQQLIRGLVATFGDD